MSKQKIKTLVCGSTFGQFYLEALKGLSDDFEIAGILSQGSERSRKCAQHYGLPMFESVEQLPNDIDLACVVLRSAVMGGQGTNLSMQLLEKGIHVIQEQPIHQDDIAQCVKMARQRGVYFITGDLFIHLPAVKRFATCAQALFEQQEAVYIDMAFASQVSFPLVHMLFSVLPSLRPFKINQVIKDGGPFQLVTGVLGSIPFTMRVHNEVNPDDPDNYLHLLHNMTIGFAGGNLSLTDTHGPVVWRPRLHVPHNQLLGLITPLTAGDLSESSTTILGPSLSPSYLDILTKQWPGAIARDLKNMKAFIAGEERIENRVQQELLCARHWQVLTHALGYPGLRPDAVFQPMDVGHLKELVAKIPLGPEEEPDVSYTLSDSKDVFDYSELAEREIHGLNASQVVEYVNMLEKAAMTSMLHALQEQGALRDTKKTYTEKEVLEDSKAHVRHYPVLVRWLSVMARNGFISSGEDGYRVDCRISHDEVDERWNRVREIWDRRLGNELAVDYLKVNADNLTDLMMDKKQAALLLFPEGRMDVANALYKESITARYLNQTVAEVVVRIANEKKQKQRTNNSSRPSLTIIEIGAGTGATSEVVVPKLTKQFEHSFDLDYVFTDVSTFFIGAAKKRFEKYPWVNFRIVDIDQPFSSQGLMPETADIIIAAGVLNNARDTDKAIEEFKNTLRPGGYMLITEPIKESLEILISQSFMMTPPVDDRKNSLTTFLSQTQWKKVFEDVGVEKVVPLLSDDHKLAPLGQQLFIVKKLSHVKA